MRQNEREYPITYDDELFSAIPDALHPPHECLHARCWLGQSKSTFYNFLHHPHLLASGRSCARSCQDVVVKRGKGVKAPIVCPFLTFVLGFSGTAPSEQALHLLDQRLFRLITFLDDFRNSGSVRA